MGTMEGGMGWGILLSTWSAVSMGWRNLCSEASIFPSTQWDGCSAVPTGPRQGQSSQAGGEDESPRPGAPPPVSSRPSSLSPSWVVFYHIKMFGLMGLTRLRGGMKKGPLFPRLLQCVLTYFWEAVADYGGRRGRPRRSCRWKGLAALGVCGGNVQSLIQGGVGVVLSPPPHP